eukprot:CAMPEP_0172309248 /NCGR_PEP_ID=MMETSP1058-20130122/9602_1 /TAXON_ID=83371 /ORGANISM="Detonula confervacea, Strain CCMP 353" /LENGTH=703 /DNA_ID=CAMNT_0013021843 /DNA_START=119 /DNA_END=2230 /DNA_ORIENTATION=+
MMEHPPITTDALRYDLAIIGRGMIGSAAARHAAKISTGDERIVLIGPSERSHTKDDSDPKDASLIIFGAHHDEGRITRRTDPEPIWAELASRSISRYEEILQESGGAKDFYSECGHLAVGLDGGDMMNKRRETAESMGVECAGLDAADLREEFPHLAFPHDCVGLYEKKHSGYISARGLVEAQTAAAQTHGVDVIDEVVNCVERCVCETNGDEYFCIEVGQDQIIKANKVLVAAGAFCNARSLLPTKLELVPIKTQTVHFVLTEDDVIRLKDMPSIIVKNDELWAYILPPIRYPDGTVRLKLGGSYLDSDGNEYGLDKQMHSDQEVVDWYQSNGNKDATRDMENMLRSFIPNIAPTSILSDTCATLNTPSRQAYIGEVEDGWAVATGGNGCAAKSSDELGRLAAMCILDREAFGREIICGERCVEVFLPRSILPGEDDSDAVTTRWRDKRKRDIAKNAALITAKALTTKRESGVLPKAVLDIIQLLEGKGETIEKMMVVRTPVQEYVGRMMNIVSIGKYKKAIAESPYDRMFHLSLVINERYVLQKNEVIALSASKSSKIYEESETMAVKVPSGKDATSVSLLLYKTRLHMGSTKFSEYCAVTNNCQDFILAVLTSNKFASPDLISFVKQDAEVIFNRLPIHTKLVAKALTNMAAVGDKLAEDIKIKHQETDYLDIARHVIGDKVREMHRNRCGTSNKQSSTN